MRIDSIIVWFAENEFDARLFSRAVDTRVMVSAPIRETSLLGNLLFMFHTSKKLCPTSRLLTPHQSTSHHSMLNSGDFCHHTMRVRESFSSAVAIKHLAIGLFPAQVWLSRIKLDRIILRYSACRSAWFVPSRAASMKDHTRMISHYFCAGPPTG